MRAVIYCRISKDREGAGLGVERQQQDCQQLADTLGWTVVDTYPDNDISAYSGKPRPAYTRMLADLAAGKAEAVIAWHTDRLHRSPAELETFIALCETHHVTVRTVQAGELDLSTPAGQMTARIVGAVARHEIDHARKRMIAAHAQGAEKGRAHGRIPWGYEPVFDVAGNITDRVPHPVNAPLVNQIVSRLLAGESGYSIAKTFNEAGIPTPQNGTEWHTGLVASIAKSPTYAGFRTHKGVTTKGSWEPIVTAEDHARVAALLSGPGRKFHRGTEPKYLLSGIAVCGVCESVVHRNKSHGKDAYTCSRNTRCVSRNLQKVDAAVEAAIIALCETQSIPIAQTQDSEVDEAAAEVVRLRARLDQYLQQAVDDEISPESFRSIDKRLRDKIEDAERRATPKYLIPDVEELVGPHAASRWRLLTLDRKRAVIRGLVTVTILPSRKGRDFRFEEIEIRPV